MDAPVPRYIDRDGAAFAFLVVGDGPIDVVYLNDLNMHMADEARGPGGQQERPARSQDVVVATETLTPCGSGSTLPTTAPNSTAGRHSRHCGRSQGELTTALATVLRVPADDVQVGLRRPH